jgi:hypothetical protein
MTVPRLTLRKHRTQPRTTQISPTQAMPWPLRSGRRSSAAAFLPLEELASRPGTASKAVSAGVPSVARIDGSLLFVLNQERCVGADMGYDEEFLKAGLRI